MHRSATRTTTARRLLGTTVATVAVLAVTTPSDAATAGATTTLTVDGVYSRVILDDGALPGTGPGRPARPVPVHDVVEAAVRVGPTLVPVADRASVVTGAGVRMTLRAPAGYTAARALAALGGPRDGVRAAAVAPVTVTDVVPKVQASAATTVTGAHSVTVLPVYWGAANDGASTAALATMAGHVRDYWREQSSGRIDVSTVTVKDWKKIAAPSGCDYNAVYNAAVSANGLPGAAGTSHYLIYFPNTTVCGWAGLGSVGGPVMWDNGYWAPGMQNDDVMAHEFGHNLGLGHANQWVCTDNGTRVPMPASASTSCTVRQYYDDTDVMGFATWSPTGNLNVGSAAFLGLADVATATPGTPLTAVLPPLTTYGTVRGVRIPLKDGSSLFADFRPAVGRDTREPGWAGVQVRRWVPAGLEGSGVPSTELLDLQPGTATAFSHPNLAAGTAYRVPNENAVLAATTGDGSATVSVRPAGGDATAPTAPAVTAPVAGGSYLSAVTATWTASTDDVAVTSYRVTVDGKVAKSVDGTATTAALTLPTGTHTLAVTAVDAAGNGTSSPPVTFAALAATAFTPVLTAPAANLLTNRDVTVAWRLPAAASSARVTVDDRALTATKDTTQVLGGLADGKHAVKVTALDPGGRPLATSAPVALTSDRTAPTAPAKVRWSAGGVQWNASTDATSGVAGYAVAVDGKALGTATATTLRADLADGSHTVEVVASDRAGNTASSGAVPVVKDTSAPDAPVITSPVPGTTTVTGAPVATVTWQAAADAHSGVLGYKVSVNGRTGPLVAGTSADVTLGEGLTTITVTGYNGAGLAAVSAPVKVLLDTRTPAAPKALTLSPDGTALSWQRVTDNGSAIGYRVSVDGAEPVATDRTTLATTTAVGEHTWRVVALDAAGHASPATVLTRWFAPDPTAAPAITSPADAAVTRTRSVTLTWAAPSDADATILAGYVVRLGTRVLSRTLPAGAREYAVIGLPEGSNVLRVSTLNRAGVESAATGVTVVVDSRSPAAVSGLALAKDGSRITFTGTRDTGTAVTYAVSVDGAEPVLLPATGTSTAVTLPQALAAGRHVVTVTTLDAAGNTSRPVTLDGQVVAASTTRAAAAPGRVVPAPIAAAVLTAWDALRSWLG